VTLVFPASNGLQRMTRRGLRDGTPGTGTTTGTRTGRRVLLAASLALPVLARPAFAWAPSGPIRLIVPYAPGGTNDEVMRVLAAGAAEHLGQPVEIHNKAGRAGVRMIAALASAPPDGLLLAEFPASAIRIALLQQLPIDIPGSLSPILGVAGGAYGTIAKKDRFPEGWPGFIAEAREKPGVLAYGSPGMNSNAHLAMARLLLRERVQVVHVPFRGAALGARALVAGDIDVMAGPASIGSAVTEGEAVWLNVWSAQRLPRWPEAPTLRELGYNLTVTAPFGIVGPPGLPPGIIAALHDAFRAAMQGQPFRDVLTRNDMTEDYRDGPAYAAFLAESARTEEMLIGRLGLQP
jgi:tripartite-type tricarboxylate transporter receptor subunit TctC